MKARVKHESARGSGKVARKLSAPITASCGVGFYSVRYSMLLLIVNAATQLGETDRFYEQYILL